MGTIVTTKTELERALKAKQFPIRVQGEYATQILKRYNKTKKIKKTAIVGGALTTVASAAAIPFTGGGSTVGVFAGAAAMGLTIGTITLTLGELAVLCGFILGMTGIAGGLLTDRKVKVKFEKYEVEIL